MTSMSCKKQLKANTELVETLKSDVGQKDWAKREWTNLRRRVLVEIMGVEGVAADHPGEAPQ
jgi:hypothetical protein